MAHTNTETTVTITARRTSLDGKLDWIEVDATHRGRGYYAEGYFRNDTGRASVHLVRKADTGRGVTCRMSSVIAFALNNSAD